MKQGRSLNGLIAELDRQLQTRKDYKSPAGRLKMSVAYPGEPVIQTRFSLSGIGEFGIKDTAHEHIGEYLGIPKRYYDKMRSENSELLTTNVNSWLGRKGAEARLVRTLDGDVRALLSDRYRPLDNYDLVKAVLPIIDDNDGGFRVESCQVTERRLYIQVVNEKITTQIKPGDTVQAGLVISNSEIGDGSLRIEPMIYRLVCTNGMIRGKALRKYHVGRGGEYDLDNAVEFYRDETRKADDRAFWMKVQDAVRGAFDLTRFHALVGKLEASQKDVLPAAADLPAVVEVVGSRYGFTETETKIVRNHFLRSGDFNRFGMVNAVTRAAQDLESYDRAIEFERFGGDVLEMPAKEWSLAGEAKFEGGELVVARK